MGIKLKIANVVEVPVRYTFNPGSSKQQEFRFFVTAERITEEEAASLVNGTSEASQESVANFLRRKITDWRNQTLVLDEDTDKPLPFSPEALDAMLSVAGLPMAMYMAYLKEVAGKSGDEVRRKN
jgi:hypothetical protein